MSKKSLEELKNQSAGEQKRLIDRAGEDASRYEMTMRGCCQSTLAGILDNVALGPGQLLKATSAMSAGVAGNGEICGALLAGILCIGLAYGRDNTSEMTRTSKTYQSARTRAGRLTDRFRAQFGSLRCNDILTQLHGRPFNLRDPEDYRELGVPEIHDKCAYITCKQAARMALEELLAPEPSADELLCPVDTPA